MLVQRFHAGICFAQQPTLVHSGHPLFSRQGHWDGGSALHCVAMALALLGKLADPVHLPQQTTGNARIFWDHAWPHYLHGLTLSELLSFVAELNLGVRSAVCTGRKSVKVAFITRTLSEGCPVIIGWRQLGGQQPSADRHAALVIGIEGRQHGRAFSPHALLLLDPAGEEPGLAGFNVRLNLRGNTRLGYLSTGTERTVILESAISIRSAQPAALDLGRRGRVGAAVARRL